MEVYVMLALIIATAAVLGVLIATMYYVFKRVSTPSPPSVSGKVLSILETTSFATPKYTGTKSSGLTAPGSSTQNTYMVALNINNFEKSTTPRIIFARMNAESVTNTNALVKCNATTGDPAYNADMIMYIDPSRNDLLIAFRVVAKAADSFVDSFCIFSVENIPIYAWTVIHVVYDNVAQNGKVYIDGKLRKVLNLFVCSDNKCPIHTGNYYTYGRELNTAALTATQTLPIWALKDAAHNIAQYAFVTMRDTALSAAAVAREASDYLNYIGKLQKLSDAAAAAAASSTCPSA